MSHDPDDPHFQNVGGVGVKKSDFVDQGTTGFDSTATIDVVINGENIKQSIGNFFANATTTVLTPVGGAGAIPTLEQFTGSANVRGLESGPGVLVALSPGNGINIKHNFAVGVGGVPVLKDPLADAPTIRSIVAGQGIAVAANNGAVQVSFTGGAAVTNTVIVNAVGDLPTPVGNVITLDTGISYAFETIVDIGVNRIQFSTGNSLLATDRITRGIISDNAGALLTASGTGTTALVKEMRLDSTAGSIFDINSGAGLVVNDVLTLQSAAVSTLADTANVSLRNYSVANGGSGVFGILWSGTCQEINMTNGFCQSWTGVMFDFGTTVFTRGMIFGPGVRMNADAGSTSIDGAAGSTNIGAGAIGLVTSNTFIGLGTALATILTTDAQWDFHKNDGVEESRTDAIITLHGNLTATTIAAVNTPVLLAGVWVVDAVSQMTGTTGGRVTYGSEQPERLPLSAILTAQMVSGGTKTVTAYIGINGVFQPNSGLPLEVTSGTPTMLPTLWQDLLTVGDFIEVFIENNTDAVDILVTDVILRIN